MPTFRVRAFFKDPERVIRAGTLLPILGFLTTGLLIGDPASIIFSAIGTIYYIEWAQFK